MRRWLIMLACLAVVTPVMESAASAPGMPEQRWPVCGQWRQVPIPDPDASGELNDIAVVSPAEAWAVGGLGASPYVEPLVLHWTGLRWEREAFPDVADEFVTLNAVAVVAPRDVWAVGYRSSEGSPQPGRPFAARWQGDRWHLVRLGDPTIHGSLEGLSVIPGTDRLWAVGPTWGAAGRPLAMLWNGERWLRYRVAHPVAGRSDMLFDVVAFAGSAWAVGESRGSDDRSRVLRARWNGSEWRATLGPAGSARAVDGTRPDRLWAVGGRPAARPGYERPGILRRNGAGWRWVYTGRGLGSLHDVVNPAPGVAWAVGYRGDWPRVAPFALHLSSQGWVTGRSFHVPGWLEAVDGTPHNLWVTRMRLLRGGEPTLYDTYHRC